MSVTLRTTVVGSYPVPAWLKVAPDRGALVDAMMVVLKTQELAGIDVVAEGELYRFDVNHPDTNGMIDYFIRPMGGIVSEIDRATLEAFRKESGLAYRSEPAGVVTGPITEGTLNLLKDYELARPLTTKPFKFTLTGPHMLSKVLMDRHYGDRAALAAAIGETLAKQVAAIDADIVQVDEANIPGSPEEGPWAASAINAVLDAVRPGVEKGVHICFGNYGGQTIQKGTWDQLISFMNELHADHLVLEFARRGFGELPAFRDLSPMIKMGLGVIDVKDNGVESPETVAGRIEAAVKVLGAERIAFVHPDCGFWMLHRSVADRKMQNLVKGRDLFLGR
jgi:5-methyltetrahydropteroyltriglutamate--homocysteine methyltransferase